MRNAGLICILFADLVSIFDIFFVFYLFMKEKRFIRSINVCLDIGARRRQSFLSAQTQI